MGKPLDVKLGNEPGRSFRVKYPGDLNDVAKVTEKVGAHVSTGTIAEGWQRVVVLSAGHGNHRLFILEPDDVEQHINFGPFFVKGPFKIAKRINHADRAREAWKTLEPA